MSLHPNPGGSRSCLYVHFILCRSGVLGIRLVVMVAFCIQGDNIQDAVAMGNRVDSWMDINRKVSSIPSLLPPSLLPPSLPPSLQASQANKHKINDSLAAGEREVPWQFRSEVVNSQFLELDVWWALSS